MIYELGVLHHSVTFVTALYSFVVNVVAISRLPQRAAQCLGLPLLHARLSPGLAKRLVRTVVSTTEAGP